MGEVKLVTAEFGIHQGFVGKERTRIIQQRLGALFWAPGSGSSGPPGLEHGHRVLTGSPCIPILLPVLTAVSICPQTPHSGSRS